MMIMSMMKSMMRPMIRRGTESLLLLLGLFIAGCSGDVEQGAGETGRVRDTQSVGEEPTDPGTAIHMPVLPGEYDPDREANQALLVGRVEIIDGCVRVVGGDDRRGVLMIWPPETTIRADGSGGYEILDHNGELLVRVGDTIRMGGGTSDELGAVDPAIRSQIEGFCDGPYWFAGHPLPREYW